MQRTERRQRGNGAACGQPANTLKGVSELTEAATVETPEKAELVISDGSHLAEGAATKLTNAIKRSVGWIVQAPALMASMAQVYSGVAAERALCRTFILLNDNEPDWAGTSQLYKHRVNQGEKDAFDSFSEDQKKTFDTNVRSHMRRTVLEPFIVKYSADKLGLPIAEPGDSPKLAAEVRAQYDRCKLAIPDRWKIDPGNQAGPGNGAIETPASKVNAAVIALKEISALERVGYIYKMASEVYVELCEPNVVYTGGRKAVAGATADFKNMLAAAFLIIDGHVTGGELEAARKAFEKHLYQD
jgi:hypothetical protein